MRRTMLGLAGGFALGYLWVRAREMRAELREPSPPLEPDPAAYGRLRRRLMLAGIVRSLAQLAVAAEVAAPLVEPGPGLREPRPKRVALVAAALALASALELPSEFVESYALERRYGLSKQPVPDWFADRAKSSALSLAIGVPLIEVLASAIERRPRSWPLLATVAAFPLLVLTSVLMPTFIAPLFNRFAPLEGELAERIRALAARYGAGDATILRVDMSRQTEKANAYVTGLLGTKRIVVGDTLLARFNEDETMFVVAHELGHYVAYDVWRLVASET
ncbi:MAG: M48 family metalloprotease, partial [Vulcanimicrobiaceae bacterium]